MPVSFGEEPVKVPSPEIPVNQPTATTPETVPLRRGRKRRNTHGDVTAICKAEVVVVEQPVSPVKEVENVLVSSSKKTDGSSSPMSVFTRFRRIRTTPPPETTEPSSGSELSLSAVKIIRRRSGSSADLGVLNSKDKEEPQRKGGSRIEKRSAKRLSR